MKIVTSSKDDSLYNYLIELLQQIKLVRGGTDLAYTLRNRKFIRDYLREKQVARLNYVEETFFNPDGSLDSDCLDSFNTQRALQNK